MLFWLLGCSIQGGASEGVVSTAVDPSAWQFPAAEDRLRYEAVRGALAARFDGGTHEPPTRLGNFLRESWQDGDDTATLSVLHAPARYPDVFGLVLDATAHTDTLAVSVHWSRDGGAITGDALSVSLDTPAGQVSLSDAPTYEVGMDLLRVEPTPAPALAGRLLRSPEALGAAMAEQAGAVARRVEDHLDSGKARRCEYGPAPSDGRPPDCIPTLLTPAELGAERARLGNWVGTQKQVADANTRALHALLVEAVPAAMVQGG